MNHIYCRSSSLYFKHSYCKYLPELYIPHPHPTYYYKIQSLDLNLESDLFREGFRLQEFNSKFTLSSFISYNP